MHQEPSGVWIMAYTTIDDPSAHFQANAYSGASTQQTITNGGHSDLQPDLLWVKRRDSSYPHMLFDSSRGVNSSLSADATDVEDTTTTYLASFNSDGFTTGTDSALADSGRTFVAWQWKANGGSTSSNTDGDITSTVQVNATAKFSILTYTGNATDGNTVGHGLGVKPDVIIVKGNHGDYNWNNRYTALESLGNGYVLHLDLDGGTWNETNKFTTTAPTTAVFSLGNHGTNISGTAHVAYCWAEVQGYSKFGSYTGNASTDGTFVYLGFKPAWLLIKRTDGSGNWILIDTKRDTHNVSFKDLNADRTAAEGGTTYYNMDLLSNGVKFRNLNAETNGSGTTYVYMAFAEQPFVTSGGVPCTAR